MPTTVNPTVSAPGSLYAREVENASIVVERRVEWSDTDASGHYHNTYVVRLMEAAEAALFRRLGLQHLWGKMPRVRIEANFRRRLFFDDLVEGHLSIEHVGRSSMTYVLEVRRGDVVVADARCVVVHVEPGAEGSTPWPDAVREQLMTAGVLEPERFG